MAAPRLLDVATPAVELIDVHKSFGHVEAVRGVSLCIERGEVVAILGPNGAGKTTCINMMLGMRRPTAGTAKLFGLSPEDRRARSRCGVMLQESGLPGQLRVRELVDLFGSYYPHPISPDRAIAMAGLADQSRVQASKLSGGQRQRLYFALAVAGDPEVLFLDEPTVGMDVESRRAFLDVIRASAAAGKTIVLTTHYLEEADELAERIVVFDQGRVIADASPREIKSQVAGKRMSFSSATPVAESYLAGLDVVSIERDTERVRILSSTPEEVLWRLHQCGVEIRDLEVTGVNLEDAFVSLTSHRVQVAS
jgi:ABC-2 type transport system ATP-binding protein